jgi:hypothetical protein
LKKPGKSVPPPEVHFSVHEEFFLDCSPKMLALIFLICKWALPSVASAPQNPHKQWNFAKSLLFWGFLIKYCAGFN